MDGEVPEIQINSVDNKQGESESTDSKQKPIIKEGYMVKKGHVRHNWKSRWFVLLYDKLCYYKTKGDLLPQGNIKLKGCSVISPDPEYTKKQFVFRIIEIKGTEYLIQCSDETQRLDWVTTIMKTIRSLNTVTKSNSLKYSDRPNLRSPAPSPDVEQKKNDEEALVILQNRVTHEDLLEAMQDREAGIQLKTHQIGNESFKLCFSGDSLITWLVSWGFVKGRNDACLMARELLEKAYLHPIGKDDKTYMDTLSHKTAREFFSDNETSFYRFSAILNNNSQTVEFDSSSSSEGEGEEESIIENLQAEIIKQGFLVKKGQVRHNWKVRKFILYDEPIRLSYYSPTKDGKKSRKGKIKLAGSDVHIVKLDDKMEDKCCIAVAKENKKVLRNHCFLIRSLKGKEHILQAPSEEEMNEWVKLVKGLIEKYENYETIV